MHTSRYTYDNEGQLTAASYQALTPDTTPSGAQRTDSFVYDQLGNRKSPPNNQVASLGTVTFHRRDNGLNQYLDWTQSAINYETNGNLYQDGWLTGSFNALNQPRSIFSSRDNPAGAAIAFRYDPLGRCVRRILGAISTYLYYDGWNLIQEGPNSSTADRIYAHGNRIDEIVASQYGGVWAYHHYDARGHCIMLMNASGNIIEQYDYDAFGKPYFYSSSNSFAAPVTSSGWGNRFLFTGREWLKEIAIYDFRNRHYMPELGRFMQPDPKQFEAGDYNLYRYCHNDPVNKSDPTGLIDWAPFQPGQWEYRDTRLFPDVPNRFDMGAHGHVNNRGNVDYITDGNGKTWTPAQLYKEVKGIPTFKRSVSVRMYICEAGRGDKDSYAKEFSKISGKPVEAGSGDLDAARYTNGKPHFSRPEDMRLNLLKPSTWKLGFKTFHN